MSAARLLTAQAALDEAKGNAAQAADLLRRANADFAPMVGRMVQVRKYAVAKARRDVALQGKADADVLVSLAQAAVDAQRATVTPQTIYDIDGVNYAIDPVVP